MRSKSFNIAVYPPKEVARNAIAVSREFKKKGGLFVLDGRNYFPHITLYMTEFPVKNMPKIMEALRDIVASVKPFRAILLKYRQNTEGYVDVVYRKSQEIEDLQKKIIARLNLLCEGLLRPKEKACMNELSAAHWRNLTRFGYRDVGAHFFPHLTFTKLGKFDASALSKIGKHDFSFDAEGIGFLSR